MADDTECDVASGGEVFDDVEADEITDPTHILQNVEDSCTKVLIPPMDQPSMVKNLHSSHSSNGHDVIFPTMKGGLSSPSDMHRLRDALDEEDLKPSSETLRKRLNSSPRVVKWSLEEMCTAMDSVIAGEATTTCAARKFGIPRTTLLDRLSMKSKKQYLDQPGSYPLNPESDNKIIELVKENVNLDRPTLLKCMLDMAEDLAREQGRPFENPLASRKWLKLFINKHNNLHIFPYHVRGVSRTSTSHPRASSISSSQQHQQQHHQQQQQQQQQATHIIQIQSDNGGGSTSPVHMEMNDDTSGHEVVERQPYDSFEASLAKQGAEAVERKLTAEQRSYFSYRFCNLALERGFDLWRLCKAKVDAADIENFESVLTSQALVAIEQALQEEHLKYFRFRYENPELEEGYKLWYLLKEKSLQQ